MPKTLSLVCRMLLFHNNDSSGALTAEADDAMECVSWRRTLSDLQKVCDSAGVTMVDASIGWLLAQPKVKSLIVGATTPEQVVQNCKQFAAVS